MMALEFSNPRLDLPSSLPLTGYAPLSDLLGKLSTERFSGRLDVRKARTKQGWSLYFCVGRLVWQAGGTSGSQRWRRLLSRYCPNLEAEKVQHLAVPTARIRDYALLAGLREQEHIDRTQLISLVEDGLQEVLFDVLQEAEGNQLVQYRLDPKDGLSTPLTLIPVDSILAKAQQAWQNWKQAGLAAVSPDEMPQINSPDLLEQQAPQDFPLLQRLINGRRSIRTLALKMQQDMIPLAQMLNGYVSVGIMSFVDQWPASPPLLLDEGNPTTEILQEPIPLQIPSRPRLESRFPKVICIDDSPLICSTMEGILMRQGYRVQSVQDPLLAIPLLVQEKPHLVFLDLVMPIANGYEICAQIRRISALKGIPVIILTGNDGLVDRVRANLAGATDFLTKPINAQQVQATLTKYVPIPTE